MQYRIVWCVALFLLLGEAVLEVRAHLRGWDTVLFGLVSSAGGRARTADSTFGPSEAFPFRSQRVERAVASVWIASASYADDRGLPPEATFPHLLQVELSGPDRQVQVLNAARAGNAILANADRLDAIGSEWNPDVVVLYSMSLDIDVLSRRLVAGELPAVEDVNHGILGPFAAGIRRVGEETTAYSLLKSNLTPLVAEQKILAPDLPPQAADDFAAFLHEFVTAVRALGAVPVLTTFAVRTEPGVTPGLEDRKFILRWNPHLSPSGWRRAVARLNEATLRFAEERGLAVIDVASQIGGREEWFRDLVHFTPEGHRQVARVLAAGLREMIVGAATGTSGETPATGRNAPVSPGATP